MILVQLWSITGAIGLLAALYGAFDAWRDLRAVNGDPAERLVLHAAFWHQLALGAISGGFVALGVIYALTGTQASLPIGGVIVLGACVLVTYLALDLLRVRLALRDIFLARYRSELEGLRGQLSGLSAQITVGTEAATAAAERAQATAATAAEKAVAAAYTDAERGSMRETLDDTHRLTGEVHERVVEHGDKGA